MRAAVEVGPGDDVLAGPRDVQDGDRDCRLSRRHCQRAGAAVQLCQALLEHIRGRVHDPRVDVAELLQAEEVGGVLGAVELVARRLIDRHGARIRRGIGLLPGMQLPRGETVLVTVFVRHDAKSPLDKDFWLPVVRHPCALIVRT
mgnify:CR=1 FL=1